MKRTIQCLIGAVFLTAALYGCNNKDESKTSGQPAPPGAMSTAPPTGSLKIGYVLHGLNDFTQVIKKGAEDAGKDLGVDAEVTGPAGFVAQDAIAMFEGMVQKKKDGLVVVPMPGEVWVTPIKGAIDAKIPVATANITSPKSAAELWVGQDEYQSGVILAQELKKILDAQGKKSGRILVGLCKPGVDVLVKRYEGFKKGMEGTAYKITEPYDVTTENTSNYSAWENLASANKDLVAAVGLCSMDIPNMAKVKARSKGTWAVAGYDLNIETLDAIKAGICQLTLGQHPYLQGYLPVRALVESIKGNKPMVKGWLDTHTEIVTKANVDTVYNREKDPAETTKWYKEHMEKEYKDLAAVVKPMPGVK
jgi:simple sugar transport system substrate-binding protein